MKNLLKKFSEKTYSVFSKDSGNMLLATGIIGTVLSSMAQAGIILTNKKFSPSQKAFMVPQEVMECILSIAGIFAVTKPVQKFASKYVKSGKFLSCELAEYLKQNNMMEQRGCKDFNLPKIINEKIKTIEKSDKYISLSSDLKNNMIKSHKQALQNFEMFHDTTSAIATTGAMAFSTAVVIPVVRNKFASVYQKKRADKWEATAVYYKSLNNAKKTSCKI